MLAADGLVGACLSLGKGRCPSFLSWSVQSRGGVHYMYKFYTFTQFPEKEYINEIFVAVCTLITLKQQPSPEEG